MDIFLESERLILRRFTQDDVDNLFELDSNPEVMRFVGGKSTPREAVVTQFLPAYLDYYRRGDRYGFWAAIEKSSGDFLGWFHFRPLEAAEPNEAELGFRLHTAAWGRGYATEGSLALVNKGFRELGVETVVASCFAANVASRRVLEKAGLTLIRTYDHSSAELGEGLAVEYALTKIDWERQNDAGTNASQQRTLG